MKLNRLDRKIPIWVPAVLSFLLAAAGILHYAGFLSEKYLAIAAGLGILALLAAGDLRRLLNWPSLFLLGYSLFSMLTLAWAMSGKFFLQRYSCIFIAAFFFLLVVLWKKNDRRFVRHVLSILVGVSTLYALGGLEGAATHHVARLLYLDPSQVYMTSRLSGIFHNANIEASFYAMGILFSVALICDGERKPLSRAIWSVTLAINAVAMVLGISLGAIASLAGGVIAYLLFAGKGRGTVMLRLLEGLLPAAFCSVVAVPYFNAESKPEFPLVLTLFAAVVTALLELNVVGRIAASLDQHSSLIRILLVSFLAIAVIYSVAALHISTPYTFGSRLVRGVSLSPGEHSLQIAADGEIDVHIYSRSREEIMRRADSQTESYEGDTADLGADGMRFVVPEDSVICMIVIDSEQPGTTIDSIILDGNRRVMLKYALLPGFVADRLQGGLTANNSYVLRRVLWQNGLELFMLSPLLGNGVGSFETGITRVQDYYFETRYVHQHYIQVLVECGAIGLFLFAGAQAAMFAAVLKKRRADSSDTFYWLYPALFAELTMNFLQMFWDVSMSILPFLCSSFAVYGLIVTTCCTEPLRFPAPSASQSPEDSEGGEAAVASAISFPTRAICMLLPFLYISSIVGNLYAGLLLKRQFSSYEDAYSTMETAIRFDMYEHNDIMLTYLLTALEDTSQDNHISQANVYADQLSRVQSNVLPMYLAGYYFNTQQYSRAIDEAKLGAIYSASNSNVWNQIIALLKAGFIESGVYSPLLTASNGAELIEELEEYRNMLIERNASSISPIALTEYSASFIDTVQALYECGGDRDAIYALLASQDQNN